MAPVRVRIRGAGFDVTCAVPSTGPVSVDVLDRGPAAPSRDELLDEAERLANITPLRAHPTSAHKGHGQKPPSPTFQDNIETIRALREQIDRLHADRERLGQAYAEAEAAREEAVRLAKARAEQLDPESVTHWNTMLAERNDARLQLLRLAQALANEAMEEGRSAASWAYEYPTLWAALRDYGMELPALKADNPLREFLIRLGASLRQADDAAA